MPKPKASQLTIRMSPQLHAALRDSAIAAGCSLNSFAIQVLASAAGHRARFRGTAETGPTPEEASVDLRELPRNDNGVPFDRKARSEHLTARQWWFNAQFEHMAPAAAVRLMHRHDREDPWFFVEWRAARRV
jgi:hypothetical protein